MLRFGLSCFPSSYELALFVFLVAALLPEVPRWRELLCCDCDFFSGLSSRRSGRAPTPTTHHRLTVLLFVSVRHFDHIAWSPSWRILEIFLRDFVVVMLLSGTGSALVRVRIILITVSFVKISSCKIMHFPWSWSDHITIISTLGTNICLKVPTQTVCAF